MSRAPRIPDPRTNTICWNCRDAISKTGWRSDASNQRGDLPLGRPNIESWCNYCQNEREMFRRAARERELEKSHDERMVELRGAIERATSDDDKAAALCDLRRFEESIQRNKARREAEAPTPSPSKLESLVRLRRGVPASYATAGPQHYQQYNQLYGYSQRESPYVTTPGQPQLQLPYGTNPGDADSAYRSSVASGYTSASEQTSVYGHQQDMVPPSVAFSTVSGSQYDSRIDAQSGYQPSNAQSGYEPSNVYSDAPPSEASTGLGYLHMWDTRRMVRIGKDRMGYTADVFPPKDDVRHMFEERIGVFEPGGKTWHLKDEYDPKSPNFRPPSTED